jgi:hypothetical protein
MLFSSSGGSKPKYYRRGGSANRFSTPFRGTPTIKEIVPPTFSYDLENYTVKKGENAVFKGTVNGSYPFEVMWYLDGDELKASSRIEMTVHQDYSETFLTGLIDYIVSLKILKCSHSDIGKYTVFVKNEAGDASCSAFLIIEGKLINGQHQKSPSHSLYIKISELYWNNNQIQKLIFGGFLEKIINFFKI